MRKDRFIKFIRKYHLVILALLPFIMAIIVVVLAHLFEIRRVLIQSISPVLVQPVSSDLKKPVSDPDFGEKSENGQIDDKKSLDKHDQGK